MFKLLELPLQGQPPAELLTGLLGSPEDEDFLPLLPFLLVKRRSVV